MKFRSVRARFWLELGLGLLGLGLAVLTTIWPDWIERMFGVDPDEYSGSLEAVIAVGIMLISLILIAMSTLEWRRGIASRNSA
jgi:hypothetical protein